MPVLRRARTQPAPADPGTTMPEIVTLDAHPRVAAVLAVRRERSSRFRGCVHAWEDARHALLMQEREAGGIQARGEQTTAEIAQALLDARRRVERLDLERQLMQQEGTPDLDREEHAARVEASREVNLRLKRLSVPPLRAFVEACEQALPHWEELRRLYGKHTRLCKPGTDEALSAAQVQPFPNRQSLDYLRDVITSYEASLKHEENQS